MIQIQKDSAALYDINEFTFQESEMGDSTISCSLKLPLPTGGRNLLLNSRVLQFGRNNTGTGTNSVHSEDGGFVRATPDAGKNTSLFHFATNFSKQLTVGSHCSSSIQVRSQKDTQFHAWVCNGNNTQAILYSYKPLVAGEWTTVEMNSYVIDSVSTNCVLFVFACSEIDSYLDYRNLKIEDGAQVTAWSPAPEDPIFTKDMYVEHYGEKFYISSTKPTCYKSTDSLMYVYSLIFNSERIDLKRKMVKNLASTGVDKFISQGLVFTLYADLDLFAILIGNNLKNSFGSRWVVDVNPALNQDTFIELSISNTYIWDLLLKTYEYYGVRWTIENIENVMHIRIGYETKEIEHIFAYGSDEGLTKITRTESTSKIANILRGAGGTKNLPTNYFKSTASGFLNGYTGFPNDPNPIAGLLSFKNLMPKCFRDSVIGGSGNFVDYVKDDVSISQIGEIEDGLPVNEKIYPSIEGVEVSGLGRIDEIVCAESILFDDPEYIGDDSVAGIECISTVPFITPSAGGGSRGTSSDTHTEILYTGVFQAAESNLVAKFNLSFKDLYENVILPPVSYVSKDGKDVSVTGTASMSATVVLVLADTNIAVTTKSYRKEDLDKEQILSFEGLTIGSNYKLKVTVNSSGALTSSARVMPWSTIGRLYEIKNVKGLYKPTFDIWVKDIGFDLADNQYTSTSDAKIVFTSGMLSGYEFTILAKGKTRQVFADNSKVLNGVSSKYRITLIKSDDEYKASGYMIPSTIVHANPIAGTVATIGDKFAITGIEMPHTYVLYAEQKLQDYLTEQLAITKLDYPTFAVETLDGFMATMTTPESDGLTIKDKFRSGNKMRIYDPQLTSEIIQHINSVTVEHKGIIPKYTAVITDKVTVNGSTVQRMQAQIDALSDGQYSNQQSAQMSLDALDARFLRKNIEDVAYQEIEFKNGVKVSGLSTDDFNQGSIAGSGAAIYKGLSGQTVIEVDDLIVRKKASFNEIIISQIKFQGGIVIYSAANMIVSGVDTITDGFRLYFDTKGNTIYNEFAINDVVRCQRFDPTNGVTKYYMTLVKDLGANFIDISYSQREDNAFSMNPSIGDVLVQFGSTTDIERQSAIEVNVLQGGRQTFYQKLGATVGNPYTMVDKNYIDIGNVLQSDLTFKNMIRVYGDAFIGARDLSSYLKFDEATKSLEIKGHVSFKSATGTYTEVGAGITAAVDNIKQSGRNYLQHSRIDSIAGWQVVGGTVEIVLDPIYGNVAEYSRPQGGGDFMKQFVIDVSSIKNIDIVYYCIAKNMDTNTGAWNFGGWSETFFALNQTSNYKELGNGWRMYWSTFLAGSTICSSSVFGLNSIGGTWRFHSFGVCKGNTPPSDWSAAPEDIYAQIEENKNYIDTIKGGLQGQIDGNIISWFRQVNPTLSNSPAVDWDTEILRNQHANDTYTNTDSGACWRFQYNGSTHAWEWGVISDTATQKALAAAGKAQDTADGKRTTFGDTPFTPYKVGDLWAQGGSGELMRCNDERLTGSFNSGDWGKASKYTDDTAVNNLVLNGRNLYKKSTPIVNVYYPTVIEKLKDSDSANGFQLTGVLNASTMVRLMNVIDSNGDYTITFTGMSNYQSTPNFNMCDIPCTGFATFNTWWHKFELHVTVTNYTTEIYSFLDIENLDYLYYYFKDFKIEKGTKATDWTPAFEDIESDIVSAKSSADAANLYIAKMSDDDIISPVEKLALKKEWDVICGEYSGIVAQAVAFSVSYTNYRNSYIDGLTVLIGTNLNNLTTDWNLGYNGGSYLRSLFSYYYDSRTALLNAVSIAARQGGIDAANNIVVGGRNLINGSNFDVNIANGNASFYCWLALSENLVIGKTYILSAKTMTGGYEAPNLSTAVGDYSNGQVISFNTPFIAQYNSKSIRIYHTNLMATGHIAKIKLELGNKSTDWTPSPEDIDNTISTAQSSANAANTAIGLMSSDNDISPVEKIALKKEYKVITDEYSTMLGQASSFSVSSSTYTTAYNYVVSFISSNLDDLTTNWNLGTNGGNVLRNTFNYYYLQRTILLNAISTAAKTAGVNAANNLVIGGVNLMKDSSFEAFANSEFCQHGDLAPIFDKYGLVEYTISFDIKAQVAGLVNVYSQNGAGARYGFSSNLNLTTSYVRRSITVTPALINSSIVESMLAFYGTYGTGVKPSIKNVKVELGSKATLWTPAIDDALGGRNFLKNSSFELNYDGMIQCSSGTNLVSTTGNGGSNAIGIYRAANVDGYAFIHFNSVPTGIYMFGVDIKSDTANTQVYSDIRLCTEDNWTPLAVITVANPIPTTWTRYTVPVNVPANNGFGFIIRTNTNISSGTIFYDNCMLELGTKANVWTPAPEDFQRQITDFSSDNLLQPFEKQAILKEWIIMQQEHGWIISQCNAWIWNSTTFQENYSSAWNAFEGSGSKYESLTNYITPLLSSLETQSTIVGADFRENFRLYTSARDRVKYDLTQMLKRDTSDLKDTFDGMVVGGENLISNSYINESNWWYGFGIRSFNVIAGRTYVFQVAGNLDQTAVNYGRYGNVYVWRDDWSFVPVSIPFYSITYEAKYVVFTAVVTETLQCGAYLYEPNGNVDGFGRLFINNFSCQEGNRPTNWKPATKYLTDAMTFDVNGGLALGYIMAMRNQLGIVTSGINGIDVPNQTDIRMWAGATIENMQNAPFRVDEYGNMTALAGKIGGLNIFEHSLVSGSMEFAEEAVDTLSSLISSGAVSINRQSSWTNSWPSNNYGWIGSYQPLLTVTTQTFTLTNSGILAFKVMSKFSNAFGSVYYHVYTSLGVLVSSGTADVTTSYTTAVVSINLVAGTYYISASLEQGNHNTTTADITLQGNVSNDVISASSAPCKTKIGNNGFFSFLSAINYMYFSSLKGLLVKGAVDMPAGLGGATVDNVGNVSNKWGLVSSCVRSVSVTVNHSIGDLKYTVNVTPIGSSSWYIQSKGTSSVQIVCSGTFDFVLVRTPF